MADVKFTVTVDSAGAVKSVDQLDKEFKELNKTQRDGAKASELASDSSRSLWQSFAVGQLAAQGVTMAIRGVKNIIMDSIDAAQAQEDADQALRASLMATGRTIEANAAHYKEMASAIQEATVYGDEAVQEVQALLLSLTRLDQEGIDRATKGVIGLATVFKMDLQSAAALVGKALEGNFGALSRYGLKVDETLSLEGKRAQLLETLLTFYEQSEERTKTFSGAVAQMNNLWGDLQEEIGGAITKNVTVRETIEDISQSIKEMMPEIKEFAETIGGFVAGIAKLAVDTIKAIQDIREEIGGTKTDLTEQEKAWENVLNAMGRYSGLTDKVISQIGRQRQDFRDLDGIRQKLMDGFDELGSRDALKKMVEGGYGEEVKNALQVVGGEILKVAQSFELAEGPINEVGESAEESADQLGLLATELKLVFREDIVAQIEKINSALFIFRDRLSPATAEALRKKLAELQAQLGTTFTGINVPLDAAGTKTESLTESLYGAKLATALFEKSATPEIDSVAESLKGITEEAADFDDQLKSLAGPTTTDIHNQMELIRRVIQQFGDDIPDQRVRDLIAELQRLKGEAADMTALQQWGERASDIMDDVKAKTAMVFSGITAIAQQSQRNKEIAIENEYKKRLATINRTIKDEEKKAEAIQTLEAEFQIKRTEAQAEAAKTSKAVALMNAIVNTADAVTKALTAGPIIGPILAGIIGAMGAVQISLIKKQPIPLATGAVFDKPTLLPVADFEVAEKPGSREFVLPEPMLREVFREVATEIVSPAATPNIVQDTPAGEVSVYINSPLIQTEGITYSELEQASDDLWDIIQRKARSRGRSL